MKTPYRFLAFALVLALYTLQAPALEVDNRDFRRYVAPNQAALVLDGQLAAIVEVVHSDAHRIKVKFDGHGSPAMREWIDNSLSMNYLRKSGELAAADFKRDIRHIREFKDALITEISFPAGDAAAKEAGVINIEFRPRLVRDKKGGRDRDEIDFRDVAGWQKVRYKVVPCIDPDCLR